eukprot:Protomagalhaensia_sp_Gyna_25__4960@NODE_539_length_3175_cov_91_364158_g422_i0_p2_GENE_NODE_539_length_3175_cov_91_364158_g422_i0NODE_539_length_3175_cov_91_364158_g422_i0_p2_ORF_typecomplete_len321_score52_51Peptidase_A22B/PF04258_13/1e03Peptidase_A22B/PF04258_13/7e59SPP/PF06550_11/1_8e04SPP/PF06550_11/1_5e09_NODE_539_length_3175_cov_91_364158_g422_i01131075
MPPVAVKTPTLAAAFANVAGELAKLSHEDFRARRFAAYLIAVLSLMILSRVIMIPVLAQMLLYTLPIIWLGSLLSLDFRVGMAEGSQRGGGEVMSSKDAAMFPVHASAGILGLYLALKLLPSSLVNIVLSIFVSGIGIFSIGETLVACLKLGFPADIDEGPSYTLNVPKIFRFILDPTITVRITKATVIGYIVGLAITVGWLVTDMWLLHNLCAIAFCIEAIHMISVGTFKVASTLLIGLFFYDVFWVFGTEVMVKVATGFKAPMKLLFPVSRDPLQFSLLGLGDIVIPGIFIAMTLRLDYWLHTRAHEIPSTERPMLRV